MSSRTGTNKRRRLLGGLSAVALATTAGVLAVPSAAQAHTGNVNISRSGCTYAGTSTHGYARSWKGSGSCTGHVWLRVNWAGSVGSWLHAPDDIDFTAPGGSGIVWSDHKSCETCGVARITH